MRLLGAERGRGRRRRLRGGRGGRRRAPRAVSVQAIMLAVASLAGLVLALDISGIVCESNARAPNGTNKEIAASSALRTSSSSLYKCELSYLQMDSSMIRFSIDHLIVLRGRPPAEREDKTIVVDEENFVLDEIAFNASFEELQHDTSLDFELPFIFFINGFNTLNEYGEINGTWMFDVAKNLATGTLKRAAATAGRDHQAPRESTSQRPGGSLFSGLLDRLWSRELPATAGPVSNGTVSSSLGANVIFLTWGIPDLLANNLLSMIPAYYKTVANYDQIMEFVAGAIGKLVLFVERSRSQSGAGWPSELERARYYAAFEFYGHSLGSHILADALQRARQTLGPAATKFGKLTGLDPATPCFLSLEHGISASKVANVVEQLMVVHSNAGLAGLTSERADVEIVLNGGTFQPGCAWYDFVCHHSRSTDILRYRDDECQMVAYKCTSFHHFKNGACETCDRPGGDGSSEEGVAPKTRNCVLVNMEAQHVDSDQVLAFAEFRGRARRRRRQRQPAAPQRHQPRSRARQIDWPNGRPAASPERAKKAYYHYVQTSPNFRLGRKSHCLQHYQLRLVIFNKETPRTLQTECRPSRFYSSGDPSDELSMSLLYELEPVARQVAHLEALGARGPAATSPSGVRLGAIIRDLFHSALVTFEGRPRLFVGARVVNLRLAELAACLKRENATSGQPTFVLDIAFMSHTSERMRRAFSSILCGQLEEQADGRLELELGVCKEAQLQNVSQQIDGLLEQIKLYRLDETWKVSLLNNLFSLLAEWEPF